jgi:hypothetical protein
MARITMLSLSASPEGVLEQGKTYDVPGDVARVRAQELVDGGFALLEGTLPGTGKKATAPAGPAPLDKRTVEQLLAYAAENDLDLGGATKRADILAAIQTAETGD